MIGDRISLEVNRLNLEEALHELMSEFLGDVPHELGDTKREDTKQHVETVTKALNVLRALPDKGMAARLAGRLIDESNSVDEDPIISQFTEFLVKRASGEPDEEETPTEEPHGEKTDG